MPQVDTHGAAITSIDEGRLARAIFAVDHKSIVLKKAEGRPEHFDRCLAVFKKEHKTRVEDAYAYAKSVAARYREEK
jgi:hypothetical protein